MSILWAVAMWVASASLIASGIAYFTGHRDLSDALDVVAACGYGVTVVLDILAGHWAAVAWQGPFLVIILLAIWRNRKRRRRKRALGLAGYKARAIKAALVRKAREAGKPRPVLRPVPGGAR